MCNSNHAYVQPTKIPSERRVLTWLRKCIHPYCWGQSDRHKAKFCQTTKRQVLSFFRGRRFDLPGSYLPKMTNTTMMGHFAGQHILYFQADGKYSVPETLVCIDIDCHKRGTYEGACACVGWLSKNGFPNLFWSRSTNGRGVHAYLRIDKRRFGDLALDQAVINLERWLQHQHGIHSWDIEQIEVKGRPPIFAWGDEKHELLDVRMGSLAKLPVDAFDRPEELMATTCLSISVMNRLGLGVPREKSGGYNCTTYSLPISTELFGQIDPADLKPFIPESRSREWPFWVERMAKVGLIEDDTMAEVVFELAKWLLWIELFGEEDREARTIELLQGFILEKNNGYVTRLDHGKEGEVLSHVERIVKGAGTMSAESKELFLRVRQKRQQRKYKRLIEIVPLLGGDEGEGAVLGTSESLGREGYNCTTYSLPLSEEPLPPTIEDQLAQYAQARRMRRSRGEYPIVRFARRFLHFLWHNQGSARIHTEDLTGMVGNVHQQNEYKQALRDLRLVRDWTGTYRVKAASCLYRLTDEAKQAFEAAYRRQIQPQAV